MAAHSEIHNFIAPEGWQNDPKALWQKSDRSFHAWYQFNPQHTQYIHFRSKLIIEGLFRVGQHLNGSCTFYRLDELWPSQIYDIRGVFDGTVFQDGFNGYPTILYTSTYTIALGVGTREIPGSETQSIAYTMDEGASWIKLNFREGGNPVIYVSPMANLTGFRNPYVFLSPRLGTSINGTASTTNATGVDGTGGKLLLYRHTTTGNVTSWTYLGPLFETVLTESWSSYSGNFGVNYETAPVTRLNPSGAALDDGSDTTAQDFVSMGTEGGGNPLLCTDMAF
ncbi:glycoside hydrolase family 32 protein [Athelia psychrophila]|uniref:Glycoside hydrolase family 32 protein n=1 Tax=Athelia psychrophila TaxID=1759441 RepID=A0A166T3J0_9AGAM|nr:glycoside hydrolase family 32 protein [Fibularhizoctonia sp. CBS 109695]